jgi:hypothetical protein
VIYTIFKRVDGHRGGDHRRADRHPPRFIGYLLDNPVGLH